MQDYICIGWRQILELQLGLIRFAYLKCKFYFRKHSRLDKPSSIKPQNHSMRRKPGLMGESVQYA